jgi:hypothetical protein
MSMRHRTLHVLLHALSAFVFGCRDSRDALPVAAAASRASRTGVIGWLTERELILRRVDVIGSEDVFFTTCDNAGLYRLTIDGRLRILNANAGLCEVLRTSDDVVLSQDSKRLMYGSRDGGRSIRMYELDTGVLTSIVPSCAVGVIAPNKGVTDKRIAFAGRCDTASNATMHLVDIDGSHLRQLGSGNPATEITYPSWSPGGRFIAIQQGSTIAEATIAVIDTIDGRNKTLTSGMLPSWKPSGDAIAYFRVDPTGQRPSEIRLIAADGSWDRAMFTVASVELSIGGDMWLVGPLLWSPSGAQVAFASRDAIWIGSSDGTRMTAILRHSSSMKQ